MNLFDVAQTNNPKRNKFKSKNNRKFSCKSGYIVPVRCVEVIPGDKWKTKASSFIRQMPLVAPMMHEMNLNFAWFFVPMRLVWNESEAFFTGGETGTEKPVKPHFTLHQYAFNTNEGSLYERNLTQVSTLADYLGFPTTQVTYTTTGSSTRKLLPEGKKIDITPFRAYQLIYNTYFRDQNLQDEVPVSRSSGEETGYNLNEMLKLRKCCWKKDYFTSALPFAQRGEEVTFSIGDKAPINFVGNDDSTHVTKQGSDASVEEPAKLKGSLEAGQSPGGASDLFIGDSSWDKANSDTYNIDNSHQLEADLKNATATSINELRRLVRLQQWFETKARGGARYIEQIFSFFGVVSDDARLQLPQYLGGGVQPFVIDSVAQTSQTVEQSTPLATLAGKGLSVGNIGINTPEFKEHGFLMCVAFARPKASYQQGLPKMFTRFDSTDYYWPTFARLGEQEVKNEELFFSENEEYNQQTFGYQSRYAEYKYIPDTVCGQLKTTLSYWHMGRIFNGQTADFESSNAPTLSSSFVECNPTRRIYAVTDQQEDDLVVEVQFDDRISRKMPFHITPAL